jgi:Xaa-Pro dipeptidase
MVYGLFPESEYRSRLVKVRAEMEENNLQALFLTSGPNHYYFSGYPHEWNVPSRPSILIIPLRDDPTIIVHKGIRNGVKRYSGVANIRTYKQRSRAPIEEVKAAFVDLGIESGVIGAELALEQRMDISMQDFLELQRTLPQFEFVDAGRLLLSVRAIKSPTEITLMRRACQITGQAFEEAFSEARAGMTEEDISRLIRIAIIERGGADPRMWITSGDENYFLNAKGPTDRVIQKGDFIWVDVSCNVKGYWSDFCRAAVVGQPSLQQKQTQRRISEITFVGVEMVRPGIKVSEIAKAVNQALQELKIDILRNISAGASRVGHGVGLTQTEPPHVAEYDKTVLKPGMVITIEPAIATTYGTFRVEEEVLVTSDGFEVLSDTQRDLWVI